jgi:protein tyrosine/serine phosphatase
VREVKILALLLLLTACAHAPTPAIENFRQVEPGLYRGGEPTATGWAQIEQFGIKTVLKLNAARTAPTPAGIFEVADAMPPEGISDALDEPTATEIGKALHALRDSPRPLYIHCAHGQDRTGLVVALYRVIVEHWTPGRARAEALSAGYHPELLGLDRAWSKWTETPPVSRPGAAGAQ